MFDYIASPYTHESKTIREWRYKQVLDYTAKCLARYQWVYSPIVHCHPLVEAHELPTDFAFWEEYNLALLTHAAKLRILCLPGWRESAGVDGEWRFAKARRIPVEFVVPSED